MNEGIQHTNAGAFLPPKAIERILLSECIETKAFVVASNFMLDEQSILVLAGGVGTGKTFAALAAFHFGCRGGTHRGDRYTLPEQWSNTALMKAKDIAVYLDPWKEEREQGLKPHRADESVQMLIDDLGMERVDDNRFLPALETIIDTRRGATHFVDGVARPRKTILTTNLTATRFRERYGERVASRINESGDYVMLTGKDLRGHGGGL